MLFNKWCRQCGHKFNDATECPECGSNDLAGAPFY